MTNIRIKIGLVFSVLLVGISSASATEVCGTIKSLKYSVNNDSGQQIEVSFVDGAFLKDVNQPSEMSIVAAMAGGLKVCFAPEISGGFSISMVSK